ncbi:hypothetical protein HYQ59_1103 [Lactobacillus crispatus]|nr:hypothetical protein [Lactobacillus crispatus]
MRNDFKNIGITSTYVENTWSALGLLVAVEDHLHIRGEYRNLMKLTRERLGSPPHTWRILTVAGSHWYFLWDHLHIRGEYNYVRTRQMLNEGSPPHTWRIHYAYNEQEMFYRITSTYVENTNLSNDQSTLSEDHLHIRGEYRVLLSKELSGMGSPPHTWRIHFVVHEQIKKYGITSTYVENTAIDKDSESWGRDHLHIRGEYTK